MPILFADPILPADQLEAGQLVCMQEINGINDEPAQRLMVELRSRTYPQPWGRSSHGTEAGVMAATVDDSSGTLVAAFSAEYGDSWRIAGDFQWSSLIEQIESLFGDWEPVDVPPLTESAAATGDVHTHHDGNQCHIGIAYPSVPYRHPDYLRAWAAVGVLSGGMSSRLFTEVREKRGLCYTVSASLQTQLDRARVLCYAGTSSERAQETLDVTFAELLRLRVGCPARRTYPA